MKREAVEHVREEKATQLTLFAPPHCALPRGGLRACDEANKIALTTTEANLTGFCSGTNARRVVPVRTAPPAPFYSAKMGRTFVFA